MAMMLMMFLLLAFHGCGGGVAEVPGFIALLLLAFGRLRWERHGHDAHDVPAVGASDGSGGGVAEVPGFIAFLLLAFGRLI